MNSDELQEHYRHLDDERVVSIALFEVRDLRREAVDILRTEIQRRGLPGVLHESIELQTRNLTQAEAVDLLSWFRTSACPLCGGTSSPLNACEIYSVLIAGCPKCLKQAITRASRRAYTSGCLGFPWGLLRAAKSASELDYASEILKTNELSDELREYVVRYAGAIHAARAGGLVDALGRRQIERMV